ncbi:hypothetical protein [Sphingomonas nostoxanthinifaciens]|uniref:hypothetical protein n=1 Tax=Sphingomonas nostoxanthinifaciens TaxID=2872652 RepID=UPI001CC1C260|nr:hypothetical protein [Sphingomonas nostoxanthinifaciens]UAK26280.1 hypothetical protein K8P63_09420 [Sphingomonas nostoxanthinifaciens]
MTIMGASDRLLLLNLGHPSRMVSIAPDGGDIQTLVADLGVVPDGIGLDPINRHIFWTYMGSAHDGEDFNQNDGMIERVNYDGSDRAVIIPKGGTFTPKQMQCDAGKGLIYWSDREGMRVMRARTDGSDVTTLIQTGSGDIDRRDRRRHCVGLALDTENGFIYWTQKGRPDGNEGRIFRAGLKMPAGADPANRPDVELLFETLPEPIDLEWHAEKSQLYWTDRGSPPAGNTLNRVAFDAGRPLEPEIILSGLKEGIGLAIDQVGKRVFVSDLGGIVRVVSLESPDDGSVIYEGHGPLTGIAYLKA